MKLSGFCDAIGSRDSRLGWFGCAEQWIVVFDGTEYVRSMYNIDKTMTIASHVPELGVWISSGVDLPRVRLRSN